MTQGILIATTAAVLSLTTAGAALADQHGHGAHTAKARHWLDPVIGGAHRNAASRARDVHRHPRETLDFFGLKPGMTVVEILPGAGWYTDILAPALGRDGRLYAAVAQTSNPGYAKMIEDYKARIAAQPDLYGNTRVTTFGKGLYDIAPAGSADMVLTFRNVHNMHMGDYAPEAFTAFFRALKPGGTLGIVDHRLPEARADAEMKTSGYMKVSTVRALAEAAGFVFAGSSEINANPSDTASHDNGVWSLPPVLRGGDKDRARYLAIGESDRMTLKFTKPAIVSQTPSNQAF